MLAPNLISKSLPKRGTGESNEYKNVCFKAWLATVTGNGFVKGQCSVSPENPMTLTVYGVSLSAVRWMSSPVMVEYVAPVSTRACIEVLSTVIVMRGSAMALSLDFCGDLHAW